MYIQRIGPAALALALFTTSPGTAATAPPSSWPVTNATPGNTNFNAGERLISASTARTLHTVWSVPHIGSVIASSNRVYGVAADRAHPLGSVLILTPSGRVLRQLGPQALGLTGTSTSAIGDRPQTIGFGNGRLVVADTTEVQAFDPVSGRRLWRVPGGAQFLTISGGVVYTGKFCENPCGVTNSYAIDLTTGKVRWVHAGNGGGQPIVAGGRLFQNWDRPNSTHIYDPLSGKLLGNVPATVLLGDASGVYAMRDTNPGLGCHAWLGRYTPTGWQVWTQKLGLCNSVSSSLGYGTLYVTAARGSLGGRPAGGWVLALNATNGHIRWARHVGSIGGISLADGLVYVLREYVGGEVLTLDAGTGKPTSALTLQRYTPGPGEPFVITGGTVYIANGVQLIALRGIPPQPLAGH
jgi:hypothetical protein